VKAVDISGVTVRPYELDDVDAVFTAVQRDRERLGQFMPWVWASRTRGDTTAFVTAAVEGTAAGRTIHCGMFLNAICVGSIGASIDGLNHNAEAGYWIAPAQEGKGIVTTAMRLLIEELFALRVHRVVLRAAVGNTRSRAVAERLGFTLEGIERESLRTGDVVHDAAVYSLLDGEWQ
jgi:ribosomal-protein-serine acetyltransferase